MSLSRRRFVQSTAAAATGLVLARGREAMASGGSRVSAAADHGNLIRLDSNENPAGPSPAAVAAIADATRLARVYPFRFEEALDGILTRHGITARNMLPGCGSSEVLMNAVMAFTDERRGLVAPVPTFEEPARRARAMKRPVHEVPVRADLQVDLDGMLRLVDGAGLVFLCNPNNPTSVALPLDDIRAFVLAAVKRSPDVVILLDEAYIEYADGHGVESALSLALSTPRVVVSRTFSKMYGMAGLRVGYAVGQEPELSRLADYSLPMSVGTIGLHGVKAALTDTGFEARERARNAEARAYTVARLESMGAKVPPSHANFVMADIGRDSVAFARACAGKGVAVGRAFPPLTTHSRISIGTMEEMRRACDVFASVLKA